MRGPLTLSEIAAQLGGRVVGDSNTQVRQIGSLDHATAEQISFVAQRRHVPKLARTRAGAIILAPAMEQLAAIPRIVTDDPTLYFAHVARLFNPRLRGEPGIDQAAHVDPRAVVDASARIEAGASIGARARIGPRAWIGAGCYVGEGAEVGEDARLYPTAVLYDDCVIGARSRLHAGAVIGADGFGYARNGERWDAIPQIGRALVGDDVDVGANTTIDRGAIDDTVIENGVKLDNQIQVGHNVRIGANTAIAACVGIAGSTVIGKNCEIGGAAMISGHLRIADGSRISAATAVSGSILQPGTYTGIFPIDDHASWVRNAAGLRRLSKLLDRVRALEKRLFGKDAP
jgi:UDP-3-O-[3-hydroxymyristoyl] glucosamine N-acyltransferase